MFPLRFLSRIALALALAVCALSLVAGGQNPAISPRVSGPIGESSLTILRGNVPPSARPEFDKGEAAPATELSFMRLVLSRSPQQQAAMDALLAQQLSKSSPNYHHWLTPEEFGRLYGPADSDVAAIVAWLQSHGFKVESIPPARNNIAFSGTVAQVEEAFHTRIHSFNEHGEQFLSNTTDPSIPSALAPVIAGVAQLNTLRPRAHSVSAGAGRLDPDTHRLVPIGEATRARPQLTQGSNGSYVLYVVPADAATIYNTPNTLNANFASSTTAYRGTGVTIAIVGDALIQAGTVVNYRSKFLNDSTAPTITNVAPAAVTGGDTNEGYLDTEIAGGLAPGAAIHFYTSTDLTAAIQQALTDNPDILSVSFGECELALGTSGNQLLNGWWQQAAMQGIAVVVSSGDSGSAGCDSDTSTAATLGLQVSGFASTPYNTAVGGTDFSSLIAGFTTYVSTTTSTSSTTPYLSALGYIPEAVWNDSTISDSTISANVPAQDPLMGNATNILAGGGGVSSCSTSATPSACTGGYLKPFWQRGAGVNADGARDIPDVALFSGNGLDGASWLVCTDDAPGGVAQDCSGTQFSFSAYGGTSAAAPAFAGILALVREKAGGRIGLVNPELYNLFNTGKAGLVFHDITQGNNSVVCAPASPDCQQNMPVSMPTSYFLTKYDTNPGYDTVTGMGSIDASQLVTNWGTATGGATATITLAPSATAITSIQPLTVNVTVAGSGSLPTPTGTVILSDGNAVSLTMTLSATGTASFSIAAGALQPGADALTAKYSGDAIYASDAASVTITMTPISYALSATTPAAVTPGNSASSTVTVSTSNGYTGSVALTCAVTNTPANAVNIPGCGITGSPVALTSSATSGTATITFTTQAPIANLDRPRIGGWQGTGATVLALLVFLGIPSRRRAWRALIGVFLAAVALLSLSACGSSTTNNNQSNPGTTRGIYTYTVTGTGTPAFTPAPTATITLTVN